jgi:hypothetical protein
MRASCRNDINAAWATGGLDVISAIADAAL